MKNSIIGKFVKSARLLKNPQCLAMCGMLLALRILVGYFSSLTLAVTPDIKIGFSFLPIAITGILFGPTAAGILGALGDIINFLIIPTGAYFPGWTVSGMLIGILYGVFLFEQPKLIVRLIICELTVGIFVEILLGSFWLYIQFSKGFWVTAAVRSLKTLIAIPIEIALIAVFDKLILSQVKKHMKGRRYF